MLKIAVPNQWPVMLVSSPGCGKSEILTQIGEELDMDMLITHPVMSDPVDMKGLPCVVNGEADFLPFGHLRAMMDQKRKKPLLVLMDDVGQASAAVQASYMQILLAREVDGKRIGDKVSFVAATNGRTDGAGVTGIITPLINRFRSVVKLEVNADDWGAWALNNNVPIELISFVKFRGDALLNNFDSKKHAKNMEPFASPRSIKFLGDWMNQKCDDLDIWKGCVGEAFAAEFQGFYRIFKQVGNLIPEIILNPKKAKILEKPDEHYAVCAALAYKATEKNIDAIGTYIERFDNAEYRTFVWKCAAARNKDLTECKAFMHWSIEHAEELQ